MSQAAIEFNPFQKQVMYLPEEADAFLGGGRGGGKSYALILLALRHIEQFKDKARILYIRRTYKGLADFELVSRELFTKVYGTSAKYNGSEHVWRLPNGGYLELGQLESAADYGKYQGRSFTLLLIDEACQFPTPDLLDMLRSNLRGAKEIPIRMVIAANPGGVGHHWVAKRYVFVEAPWKPFYEIKSKRTWVYAPSTFDGNQFIDRDKYHDQLESSCPNDPELLRAWVEGDWAVNRGAYFASVLDESRNAIDPWPELPSKNYRTNYYGEQFDAWEYFLAHDFGSSAPSVTYVVARSPGAEAFGKYYSRDSLILVDELSTSLPDQPHKGAGWTVPILSEEIIAMCRRWGIKAKGCADDAIFSKSGHAAGSIADEFIRGGVRFSPAKKADRLTGWNIMRRMLADAGNSDVPGLYISRSCEYFWQTVPYLGRDPKRVEDVDSQGVDHAADAVRYGCLWKEQKIVRIPILF